MADDLSDCPTGSSTGDEAQRANRLEADLLGLVDVRDQAEFERITREGEIVTENLNRSNTNKMCGQGPVLSSGSGQGSGGSAGSQLQIGSNRADGLDGTGTECSSSRRVADLRV